MKQFNLYLSGVGGQGIGLLSETILRAASWKSHNTFTTFYLRDLSTEADGLLALGPLVASRSVVRI